jgi:hypothetical protein
VLKSPEYEDINKLLDSEGAQSHRFSVCNESSSVCSLVQRLHMRALEAMRICAGTIEQSLVM